MTIWSPFSEPMTDDSSGSNQKTEPRRDNARNSPTCISGKMLKFLPYHPRPEEVIDTGILEEHTPPKAAKSTRSTSPSPHTLARFTKCPLLAEPGWQNGGFGW